LLAVLEAGCYNEYMRSAEDHEFHPPIGSHLVTPRLGYRHHGIYCGEGRVIHFSGLARWPRMGQWHLLPRLLRMSRVEEISLEQFSNGYGYKVVGHPHARFLGLEAVARARSRLGERGYAAFSNNCEHFVNWCVEGEPRSWLIWRLLILLGFSAGGLRLLLALLMKQEPSRTARCLVGSGVVALVGAMAMTALTRLSLHPARGLTDEELYFRRIGR